jgi:hypothetical protein
MGLKIMTILFVGFILVGCGSPEHVVAVNDSGASGNLGAEGEIEPITFETIATQVLPACTRCHQPGGRLIDLTSYEAIMAQPALVVPGSPQTSRLYVVVQQGIMPPRGPLLAPELQDLLFQFIAQGAVRSKN